MYPNGKYLSSGRFSTGPHCQDHPTVLSRILDSDRLTAIFAGLENAGLLYLAHFLGERSSDTSSQSCHTAFFHCRVMGPASGRMSARPAAHFCCRLEAIMSKNDTFIE
jgi:hypothetical protein